MQEKLSQVMEVLKQMGDMTGQSMLVELYDRDGILVFTMANGDMSTRLSVGQAAQEDADSILQVCDCGYANREKKESSGGKMMEYNYVPVKDSGETVGCIVTAYGKSTNNAAIEKAEVFMDCIDRISNSIDMMSIHFENLFDRLQGMNEKTGSIERGVEETSGVVAKIRANASKSKILALNASIEAARSGEAGRGFTVVAKEMGEMATASGSSASEINTALQSIFEHLREITSSITEANEVAEKQTVAIKEIEECLGAALQAAMELGEALQEQM